MPLQSTFSAASINGWKTNDYVNSPYAQVARLIPSTTAVQDFGYSFSTTTDFSTFLVGAPLYSSFVTQQGRAYVFTGSTTTGVYTQIQALQGSDTVDEDSFGFSVSLSENKNYFVVGAPGNYTGLSRLGAAYVFVKSGSTYVQQQKIAGSGGSFGECVSIDSTGTYLIVGSPSYDSGVNNRGRVDIYSRSGSVWSLMQTYIGDATTDKALGVSVNINSAGDTIWVGDDGGPGTSTNNVFYATRSGSTWSSLSTVIGSPATGSAMVSPSPDNQYIAILSDRLQIKKYVSPNYVLQTTISLAGTFKPTITDPLAIISSNRYLMTSPYLYSGLNSTWTLLTSFYGSDGYYTKGPSAIDSTGTYFAAPAYDATISGTANNGALYIFKIS